jgi:membrane-associated phospholipid phosphatase
MAIRARWALAGGAGCVVLLVATWFAAFHVGIFRNADQSIFSGFYGLTRHGPIDAIAWHFAELCNPGPYLVLAAIPIVVALATGRRRAAVTVAAILLGANLTTEVLKPLLAEPRATSLLGFTPVGPASWPSGHATAAMSLALSCVIAAPARVRPVVGALGALFSVAVSYSFLALGWHYPSDVIGGFLVAATWALLAIAGLWVAESRSSWSAPAISGGSIAQTIGPLGATLARAAGVAALVLLTRPHAVVSYAHAHEAFVAGAAVIAACSVALSTAIVLTVRR